MSEYAPDSYLKLGNSTEVLFTVVHGRLRVSKQDVPDVRQELIKNGFEVGPLDVEVLPGSTD
jgi:hypothetical protein